MKQKNYKRKKKNHVKQSNQHFHMILEKCKAHVNAKEFELMRLKYLEKNPNFTDIPTVESIDSIYENFNKKELSRKNYKNKYWSDNELKILIFMVILHACSEKKDSENFVISDWKQISRVFPSKNAESCKFKCFSLYGPKQTVCQWTAEEDEQLKKLISPNFQNGINIKWAQISVEMNKYFPSVIRSGKQCRERYMNHLNPNLKKGKWTQEEDIQLLEKTLIFGNCWAKIARELVNRTENSVKNRFACLTKTIKKKKNTKFALINKNKINEIQQIINKIKTNLQRTAQKEENIGQNLHSLNLIEENNNKNNEFPEFIKENSLLNQEETDNSFFDYINHNKFNKQNLNNFPQERENTPNSDYPESPFNRTNNYGIKSDFPQYLHEESLSRFMDFSSFLKKYVNSQTPYLETEFKTIRKELLEFSKKRTKWLDSDDSILSEEDFLPKDGESKAD